MFARHSLKSFDIERAESTVEHHHYSTEQRSRITLAFFLFWAGGGVFERKSLQHRAAVTQRIRSLDMGRRIVLDMLRISVVL